MPTLWTQEETETLTKICKDLAKTPREITRRARQALPRRGAKAIRKKMAHLGLHRTLRGYVPRRVKPWSERDLAALEKICKAERGRGEKYRLSVWEKLTKRFPKRTKIALRQVVYQRNLLPKKWSRAEEELLRLQWGVDTTQKLRARFPYRSFNSIVEKARRLGLENKGGEPSLHTAFITPQGYASLNALAKRFGFEIEHFKRILRDESVKFRLFGYHSTGGYLHADVGDVTEAVERWSQQETPAMAARRLDVGVVRLYGWIRLEGISISKDAAGRTRGFEFRKDPAWYDALAEKNRPIPNGCVGVAELATQSNWGYSVSSTWALLAWAGVEIRAAYPKNKKNRLHYVKKEDAYRARELFRSAENLRDAVRRLGVNRKALSLAYRDAKHDQKPTHKFLASPEVWTALGASLAVGTEQKK